MRVATSYTQPLGWSRISLAPGTQSFGPTLLPPPLYRGTVKRVEGSNLYIQAIENFDVRALATTGRPVYLEFTEGPAEGERIDVDLDNSTAETITLNLASPNNTTAIYPAGMAGARFVLWHYATLGDTFPKERFASGTSSGRADKVLRRVNGTWTTYYLLKASSLF